MTLRAGAANPTTCCRCAWATSAHDSLRIADAQVHISGLVEEPAPVVAKYALNWEGGEFTVPCLYYPRSRVCVVAALADKPPHERGCDELVEVECHHVPLLPSGGVVRLRAKDEAPTGPRTEQPAERPVDPAAGLAEVYCAIRDKIAARHVPLRPADQSADQPANPAVELPRAEMPIDEMQKAIADRGSRLVSNHRVT